MRQGKHIGNIRKLMALIIGGFVVDSLRVYGRSYSIFVSSLQRSFVVISFYRKLSTRLKDGVDGKTRYLSLLAEE